MTPKMRRFCLEYLKDMNGAKAAIRAGYSRRKAKTEAWRLLRNKKVSEYIRSAIEDQESRVKVDADKVIKELARIAFFDTEALELVAEGELKVSDLTRDERAAISEVHRDIHTWSEGRGSDKETHTETSIKVKAHSKTKALEILAKHFNLFKEKGNDENGTPFILLKYPEPKKK